MSSLSEMNFEDVVKKRSDGRLSGYSIALNDPDDEWGFWDYAKDIAKAPVHGALGLAESVMDLGADVSNAAFGTDYRAPEINDWIAPQSTAGSIVSGVTQFAAGFGGVGLALKGAGIASKVAKAGKGAKLALAAAQGGAADFVSFQEHEARLSNLVNEFPSLKNPVTEYLAADESDSWAEGRFKNVVEGMGLGLATGLLLAGLKKFKTAKKIADTKGTQEADKFLAQPDESFEQTMARLQDDISGTPGTPGTPGSATKIDEALEVKPQALLDEEQTATLSKEILDRTAKGISLDDAVDDALFNHGKFDLETHPSDILKIVSNAVAPAMGDTKISFAQIDELADELGVSAKELMLTGRKLAEELGGGKFEATVKALQRLTPTFARRMALTAQRALATGDPRAEAEFTRMLPWMAEHLKNVKTLQAAGARSTAMHQTARNSFEPDGLLELIAEFGGRRNIKQIMADMAAVASGPDPSALVKIARKAVTRSKFWGVVHEFRINALLSRLVTHAVNTTSTTMHTMMLPIEKSIGGVLTLDGQAVKEGMGTFMGLFTGWKDSIKATGLTIRRSWDTRSDAVSGVLDPVIGTVEKPTKFITAQTFGASSESITGRMLNFIGQVVRLPTTALSAQDEFLKQINYRAYAKQFLTRKGLELVESGKIEREKLGEYIERGMANAFDAHGVGRIPEALAYAREATFQTPLIDGVGASIEKFVKAHPWARLFAPFVRTPTNLIKGVWRRTPLLGALEKEWQANFAAGGERRAQALGQWATGSTMFGLAASYAAAGRITGGGPSDHQMKQQLMATGWRPYSIVVKDSKGEDHYISFNRLDPFAMFLGLAADYTEIARNVGDSERDQLVLAGVTATIKNLSSKTYLTGIIDVLEALDAPDEKLTAYTQRFIGSFVPNFTRDLTNDPYLREARGIFDDVKRRVPGLSETLAPRRNIFGEPIPAHEALGPDFLSPFAYSKGLSDAAKKEISRLPHKFMPIESKLDGIDLRDVKDSSGRSAHDRLGEILAGQKIGGKTLLESLNKLVASPLYQRLPDVGDGIDPTGRVDAIGRVLSAYKSSAKSSLLRENPELLSQVVTRRQRVLAGKIPQIQAALGVE